MSNEPYAIIAVIEQAVVEKLAAFVESQIQGPGRLTGTGPDNLWQQLHGQVLIPSDLDLSFLTDMSTLILPFKGAKSPLDAVRALFTGPRLKQMKPKTNPPVRPSLCPFFF